MIDSKYDYFAFISYCWEDDKMAAELQKTLESYKFPTSLREKNPNLPSKIRPVFRDKTDLNGPRLEEALMTSLESSRYLIVICSPQAAKSNWVNRGIQRFIDLGREEDIIPFIIEGEANADAPQNECFPPALRSLKGERAIYGININDNGRDAAAVKVVSRMFDVKYDALWNRFLLEQKKRRRYTIAGLGAVILIIAGVAGYIWVQNQELDKRNLQIETQYQELQTKNAQIEQQNKDLDAKSDSITNVNTALVAAKDSIQRAYEKLDLSEKNLAKINANLIVSQQGLLRNQSMYMAKEANELITQNRYGEAATIARNSLPNSFDSPNRPLVVEAEEAFRNSLNRGIFGDRYGCVSSLIGHTDNITHIDISENSQFTLSIATDNTLRVWNTFDGRQILCIKSDSIQSAYFIDNDLLLITQSELALYEFDNTRCLKTIKRTNDNKVTLSPNRLYMGCYDSGKSAINFFNTKDFEQSASLLITPQNNLHLNYISFDNVNTLLLGYGKLYSGCCLIEIWDIEDHKITKTINLKDDKIDNVIISGDGKYIAYNMDEKIYVIDITNNERKELIGHTQRIETMAFAPNNANLLLSGGYDDKIYEWNIKTSEKYELTCSRKNWPSCLGYSNDGNTIIAALWDEIYVWQTPWLYNSFVLGDNITDFSFSSDGNFVLFVNEYGVNKTQLSNLKANEITNSYSLLNKCYKDNYSISYLELYYKNIYDDLKDSTSDYCFLVSEKENNIYVAYNDDNLNCYISKYSVDNNVYKKEACIKIGNSMFPHDLTRIAGGGRS